MNNINISGRLGQVPELRYTKNQIPFCKFGVAVNSVKKTGEKNTSWINCECYRQAAFYLTTYGVKGARIAINGELQPYNFIRSDGIKVQGYAVVANKVELYDYRNKTVESDEGIAPALSSVVTYEAPPEDDNDFFLEPEPEPEQDQTI